jgi:ribosome-binding factor A
MTRRTDRLNSLLKEVIADVIHNKVKNPYIKKLVTVTRVDISKDLRHAKVYISVIGDDKEKEESLNALQQSSGFIAATASKQVVLRFFPDLKFILDDSAEQHARIEALLKEVESEREKRNPDDEA